ncbi:hypothetical protein [Thermofilum pendens]|uniref:Uncharacterized protein n=1 Tax=Thermofilum pendens (strain DSM 2475 / Hrk 5) TaxID=368408 RepID=A1RX82_THEPD|nr:hypothetical protein [Thermofilum pendens]ABL77812.1 hypothetical protein Tpen_0403 [Thermofilum pendens Hrk 5]
MPKTALYVLSGVSVDDLRSSIARLNATTRNFSLESVSGGEWVTARLTTAPLRDNCYSIRIRLSKKRGWLWGEEFVACIEEYGESVRLTVRRVKGVGRVGSDLIGAWIIEDTSRELPWLEVRHAELF